MGAISDAATFGDFRRFRAWMLAMAVAIVGAQALQAGDLIDLSESIYLTANFGWLGAIVGGLLFGFGMTIAGGCGTRNLVRFGAGDLRSLVVVLVLGIFAYMTLRGLTGLVRVEIEGATNVDFEAAGVDSQGIGALLAGAFGAAAGTMNLIVAAVVVAGLLIWFSWTARSGPRRATSSPASASASPSSPAGTPPACSVSTISSRRP